MNIIANDRARAVAKVLVGTVVVILSVGFFGGAIPTVLIGLELVPNLGVAGWVYFPPAALVGLVLGLVMSIVSLRRSTALWTKGLVVYASFLLLGSIAVCVGYVVHESILSERASEQRHRQLSEARREAHPP